MIYLRNIVLPIYFLIFVIGLIVLLRVNFVYAAISDYLNATIKISICGNKIIEGGEDCEGDNLNGQVCESLGYGPGTLSCDIACSFDTHGCSPAPTPTPTPSPSPTSTSTLILDTTVSVSETTPVSSPSPTESLVIPTVLPPSAAELILPVTLSFFDPDKDGRISPKEVFMATKEWVEEWRQAVAEEIALVQRGLSGKGDRKCDLNKDNICDLKDLSILLYYVEK